MDFDLSDVTSVSIILVAFLFQFNLFPIYNNLKHKSNESAMCAVHLALGATSTIYTIIAVVGIFFFGSAVKNDVLKNVAMEGDRWESIVLRFVFAFILSTHIPFLFFPGKESMLIVIDEF